MFFLRIRKYIVLTKYITVLQKFTVQMLTHEILKFYVYNFSDVSRDILILIMKV